MWLRSPRPGNRAPCRDRAPEFLAHPRRKVLGRRLHPAEHPSGAADCGSWVAWLAHAGLTRYGRIGSACATIFGVPLDLPDYADAVLAIVERIPRGHVLAYGDIAELVGEGGPRQVAKVMSTYGGAVAWHRVIRADGTPAPEVAARQLTLLRAEGVPTNGRRVDMRAARWHPEEP